MATTNFVDGQTVISADWLNDVDEAVYNPSSITLPASSVTTTAISGITATDVQGVLAEIVAEKQPLDSTLTALATATEAADKIPYFTGTTTAGTLTWNSASALAAGATTISSNTVIKAAIDAMDIDTQVAPSTSGNVLTSNGTTWVSAANTYKVKAFVSFDATRNAAGGSDTANTNRYIRASYGVDSVLKTADGVFTVNVTSGVLSTANYASSLSAGGTAGLYAVMASHQGTQTTAAISLSVMAGAGAGTGINFQLANLSYNSVTLYA